MTPSTEETGVRGRELRVFLFLTVVLFPMLAVMLVAGYGFAVWIWQILMGPPGI
jgi:periplasmic nitrate reductase NapE